MTPRVEERRADAVRGEATELTIGYPGSTHDAGELERPEPGSQVARIARITARRIRHDRAQLMRQADIVVERGRQHDLATLTEPRVHPSHSAGHDVDHPAVVHHDASMHDTRSLSSTQDRALREATVAADLPRADARDRLFPWGTPLGEEGCRAAGQVPKAATREPAATLPLGPDIALS